MKNPLEKRSTTNIKSQGVLSTGFLPNLNLFIPDNEFYEVELAEVVYVPLYTKALLYGLIYCKLLYTEQYTSKTDSVMMLPRSSYDVDIPIVGEVVLCSSHPSVLYLNSRQKLTNDQYYYFDIYGILNKQNHNACMGGYAPTDEDFLTLDTEQDTFGRKFISNQLIVPQLPYLLGDKLITGRFGNCIRFTHEFNEKEDKMLPQIKISNNNYKCVVLGDTKSIKLNLNISGASLYLYYHDVEPENYVTLSAPRTKLDEISQYSLLGNGIFLNSDKLFLNSVGGNILIYSKTNVGISSVNNIILLTNHIEVSTHTVNLLSIDSIDISTKNLTANINKLMLIISPNVKINSDNIVLGLDAIEPLVLGNQLISILSLLCTAIGSITVNSASPGSPTTPPNNKASFTAIAAKLNSILSKTNKTK